MNRRDLLRRGFVLAAAAAVPTFLPFKLGAQPSSQPKLDLETFQQLNGATFRLMQGRGSSDAYLRLVEVKELVSNATPGSKTKGFVLRFYGGPNAMLKQGLYKFRNEKLGDVSLF